MAAPAQTAGAARRTDPLDKASYLRTCGHRIGRAWARVSGQWLGKQADLGVQRVRADAAPGDFNDVTGQVPQPQRVDGDRRHLPRLPPTGPHHCRPARQR